MVPSEISSIDLKVYTKTSMGIKGKIWHNLAKLALQSKLEAPFETPSEHLRTNWKTSVVFLGPKISKSTFKNNLDYSGEPMVANKGLLGDPNSELL